MPRRQSINAAALAAGIAGVILLTRSASYLTPYRLYFSFSAFLYSHRSLFRWEALALKLAIPCLVGFLLYWLPFQWMKATRGSRLSHWTLYRYVECQAALTAQAAAFLAALILAWPYLVYWDVLMAPTLQDKRLPFLCVYLLYFIAYAYFAWFGVNLARFAVRRDLPARATRDVQGRLAWAEAVRTSLLGIVTSGIATYLASQLGRAP